MLHMTSRTLFVAAVVLVSLPARPTLAAQQDHHMPAGMTHEQHLAQMKKDAELKQHGQAAMGFDQDEATHHFTLTTSGGTIAAIADDAADYVTRDQIRTHLQEIARSFSEGDFEKPLLTHGELPPGVGAMQRLKSSITYTFESTERGGVVRIATSNAQARDAIHEFLRYQITEHRTGDPVTVQK